ncbi:response regulator transcription factor [Chitinophaga caseinilytica]|uniref:Response regulator transcription factor n=1 Tax=Chitinophaga caseinilytica TaxID=2267521 RepID=A0ABZ2YY37_9BACT
MSGNTIQIAIVDDHPLILEGLQKLLDNTPGMEIAGCFSSAAECLDFLRTSYADILLLDIGLPDASGLDLCRDVKTLSPSTRVLALSNHSERSMILQMLQQGASGYLLKNVAADELVRCIHEAHEGLLTFSKAIREIMAKPSASALRETPQLTRREKEILLLIADGKTTADIASFLHLSPLTIETHRKNLLQKFGTPNVAAMIKLAVQLGLM